MPASTSGGASTTASKRLSASVVDAAIVGASRRTVFASAASGDEASAEKGQKVTKRLEKAAPSFALVAAFAGL
jgi:hypothetical protein